MYYKKIVGEDIYLSPMDYKNEVDVVTRWLNEDYDIAYNNSFYQTIFTNEKVFKLLEDWSNGDCALSIVTKDNDTFIGHISLFHYRKIENGATLGIYIDEAYRGKGYGKQAITLLLEYAFKTLNYNFIRIEVFAYNKKALALYRSLGFQDAGSYRRGKYHQGNYYDTMVLDILKEEFLKETNK